MRRAYIGADITHEAALPLAVHWAGSGRRVLIAPSTSAVQAWPPLERSDLEIGVVGNRRSRFTARPDGTVIAWCLNQDDVLEIEGRPDVHGVVVIQADKRHRAWVTAHDPEHLAGAAVAPLPDPAPSTVRLVDGLTSLPIRNQGLTDRRERDEVNQALTHFGALGIPLEPEALTVAAIRAQWPGTSPLKLAALARAVISGKQPRFSERLRPTVIDSWATGARGADSGPTDNR